MQSINPFYLSTTLPPTSIDPTRSEPIDRKTDYYARSYSHRDHDNSALYVKLDSANQREIGHS
jgi:hypothetical protein